MHKRMRIAYYAFLTVVMMTVIYVFSAQDGTESEHASLWFLNTRFGMLLIQVFPGITGQGPELDIRKYAHMAEFAALAVPTFLLLREVFLHKKIFLSGFICTVFCYLYACTDEIHQAYVPGRCCTFSDTMVDLAGTVFGLLPRRMISVLRKEQK